MEISKDHPRYRSLVIRERMGDLMERGVVARTGLIAHGRGEAFDYLIGERTTPSAEKAEMAAAAALLRAERPVITINGNAAGLAAKEIVELAALVGAKVEVNLFHRTEGRVEAVCRYVEEQSGAKVLGRTQDSILQGIASDRAKCCSDGIFTADVVLIPLEDGDRAEALVNAGKKVIAIDLNPLSRTALAAHISIVDELTRALPNIMFHAMKMKGDNGAQEVALEGYDNQAVLADARAAICVNMSSR